MGLNDSGPPSPAQKRDEPGWGLFCEIFVTTDRSNDALEQLTAAVLDAAVERHGLATTIVGPGYDFDVHRNERVLAPADPHPQQTQDFVAWPYYLEIDAPAEQTRPAQIAVIARVLLGLWEAGLGAVAVCDCKEELPQRGGYNPSLPRTAP
jgi:hypothetical protein